LVVGGVCSADTLQQPPGDRAAIVIVTGLLVPALEDRNNEDSKNLLDDCNWLNSRTGPAPRWMCEEELRRAVQGSGSRLLCRSIWLQPNGVDLLPAMQRSAGQVLQRPVVFRYSAEQHQLRHLLLLL